MASTAGPIVSPMSPAIKRSTRKRQRPTFFAEEVEASVASSTTKRHHNSSTARSSSRQKQNATNHTAHTQQHHVRRAHAPRSQLSELHDTVSDLRGQIESATVQMQELRSLVTLLADLYRGTADSADEPKLFSPASSELDVKEEHDVFLTTSASEHDVYEEDDDDDFFSSPLSPLLP